MQQGGKKTSFYTGITIIGLLLSILLVVGLHNTSPKNEAKTVQASLADATPAGAQAMHTLHPLSSNPAKQASTTLKDKNRQTSSPNTVDALNKNQDNGFGYMRQLFSAFKQACIVVIKRIVAIVPTIIACIIKHFNNAYLKRFNNAYGCRTSYDNLLVSPSEKDYYALLRINAATIGYGGEGDHSLSQVVHKLKAIAKDPRNKGLFIVLYNEKILYNEKKAYFDLILGHCCTLGNAIEAYKQKTGRTVIAYGETFMPEDYFVATRADKIYLVPTGTLTIPMPVVFPHSTLRNVHEQPLNHEAKVEVVKKGNRLVVGKYKVESCENDEEDNFKKCYQDPYIQRVCKIKAAIQAKNYWWKNWYNSEVEKFTQKQIASEQPFANLAGMPIKSQDAYRMGLVDGCCEKQNIIANLDYPVKECPVHFPKLILEAKWALSQQPAIEVVFIKGDIDNKLVARIAPLFKLLAKAEQVKGLILVIDSKGGASNAGKAISTMVKSLKAAGKVIFTYTEGFCCSAAYRIGCTAHKMFARETACVGSIGTTDELSEGHYGIFSLIQENVSKYSLRSWAQEFIDHVASCRAESLDASKEALAETVRSTEARVFHGQRAKDLQLIDEIGTLDTTIAAMKTNLGCPDIKVFYREHRHA